MAESPKARARRLLKAADARAADPEFKLSRADLRKLAAHDHIVVTSVQNNTPLDAATRDAFRIYCEETGAALVMIPVRYRNPNSPLDPQDDGPKVWWPEEIGSFATLCESEVLVHRKLKIMGDMRIGATAGNPLGGLDPLGGPASTIYGHAQLQMRTVPTPQQSMPKVLYTTGSCSELNYSKSPRGKKALFHHSHGAISITKRGRKFHLRPLTMDRAGGFYDLNRYYSRGGVKKLDRVPAVVLGDEHVVHGDEQAVEAVYGRGGVVQTLRPHEIIHHDLIDSYSISHHHRQDPITTFAKHAAGVHKLEDELRAVARYLDRRTPKWAKSTVVSSNHHEHILRWLKEADPKREPWNAMLYHRLMLDMLEQVTMGKGGVEMRDPFAWWMERYGNLKSDTQFLKQDESHMVAGVETGHHGNYGPDGAWGSARNFAKIGVRTVLGHSHKPCIWQGCMQVGCLCELNQDYVRGPSSRLHALAIIHPNGKRQMILVIKGSWR